MDKEPKELKLRIPPALHARLAADAKRHHRSLNQEAIAQLEGDQPMPKTTVRDIEHDRSLRENIAGLALHKRQEVAEMLGWIDGLPLTEDDYRHVIQGLKDSGADRDEIMAKAGPPEDVTQRRIGSLNPDEFRALFRSVWPSR